MQGKIILVGGQKKEPDKKKLFTTLMTASITISSFSCLATNMLIKIEPYKKFSSEKTTQFFMRRIFNFFNNRFIKCWLTALSDFVFMFVWVKQ